MCNRPKEFKKNISKGRCLKHYNSIFFHNRYYRWIFQYDNGEFGHGKYQGIKLEVNLK